MMTPKQIAAIRSVMVPIVQAIAVDRKAMKEDCKHFWELADRYTEEGREAFEELNCIRDQYRKATKILATVEGILTECKREERRRVACEALDLLEAREQELVAAQEAIADKISKWEDLLA
jgi:hypothetical protein